MWSRDGNPFTDTHLRFYVNDVEPEKHQNFGHESSKGLIRVMTSKWSRNHFISVGPNPRNRLWRNDKHLHDLFSSDDLNDSVVKKVKPSSNFEWRYNDYHGSHHTCVGVVTRRSPVVNVVTNVHDYRLKDEKIVSLCLPKYSFTFVGVLKKSHTPLCLDHYLTKTTSSQ